MVTIDVSVESVTLIVIDTCAAFASASSARTVTW